MANRVNPEKPAHKTAAELKKLEEIKNKVAEYERNPPFDKSKLYMSCNKDEPVSVEDVMAHFNDVVGGPQHVGKRWCAWALEEYQKKRAYLHAVTPDSEEPIYFDDFMVSIIPKVDIKFKIYRLANFDNVESTYNTTVTIMLDWLDPSLKVVEEKGHEIDWEDHFWPKFEMQGFEGDALDWGDGTGFTPKYKPDKKKSHGSKYRASITYKFPDQVVYARLNFRRFPFDYQVLEYTCKLLSIRLPDVLGRKDGARPRCCNPSRWRLKDGGHELLKEADCLADFSLLRMVGKGYSSSFGPFPELLKPDDSDRKPYLEAKEKQLRNNEKTTQWLSYKEYVQDRSFDGGQLVNDRFNDGNDTDIVLDEKCDQYTLQVVVHRNSLNVMWNMCFSLFVIDCLVFTAHGIPIGDLADRLSVNLTLLLTAMAFKWVLNDGIPNVPYLTTMEWYVVLTFMMLFVQGMSFWVFADLYAYRCDLEKSLLVISDQGNSQYTDWITGEQKSNGTFVSIMHPSCSTIHVLDRTIMFLEMFFFLFKNLWFVVNYINHADGEKLKRMTHFENLSEMEEFTADNNILWPGLEAKKKRDRVTKQISRNISNVFAEEGKKSVAFNAVEEFVLLAVTNKKSEPNTLLLIDDKLKNNEKIVTAAVSTNGMALKYASGAMKGNKGVVLAAVKQNGFALQYATDECRSDEDVVRAAIAQHGGALKFARTYRGAQKTE